MLNNYENKIMFPDIEDRNACPSCKKQLWRKPKNKKYLICKECGFIKEKR